MLQRPSRASSVFRERMGLPPAGRARTESLAMRPLPENQNRACQCPCGTKDSGHPRQRTGDESQHFHRRHYLNRKHHDCAVRSQPARFTQTRTTAGSQHQLQNDDSRSAKLSCKLLGCSCSSDLGPLMLRVIFHSVLSYFPSFIGLYRSIL
jgi:hypothetical protein